LVKRIKLVTFRGMTPTVASARVLTLVQQDPVSGLRQQGRTCTGRGETACAHKNMVKKIKGLPSKRMAEAGASPGYIRQK
jgi:hypothetical protein